MLPATWTDAVAVDAFVALSAGRSYFRPDDLLQLASLLRDLERVHVKEITPQL
jgi:Family of unknown function (DUF5372)